jgi:PRTRC genetic system protein B
MIDVTIGTAGVAPRWKLASAVLVYQAEHAGNGEAGAYATVHGIESKGKKLALAAGVPATKEACAELARALGAASTLSGFVPAELLYLGARSIAWWRRPAPATMYFDTTKDAAGDQQESKTHAGAIGKRSGRTPQPGLVFAVAPGHWYVYAVKGAARPAPDAPLYRAPYFNVWGSGEICTGNVRLPATLSTSALERYERAFFESEFTHPNVRAGERLVRKPARLAPRAEVGERIFERWDGSSYTFWRELLDRPLTITEFPEEVLVDAKCTLEQAVKKIEKGGRE